MSHGYHVVILYLQQDFLSKYCKFFEDASFQNPILNGTMVSHMTQVCVSAILLLLIVGN